MSAVGIPGDGDVVHTRHRGAVGTFFGSVCGAPYSGCDFCTESNRGTVVSCWLVSYR